jgi:membrane fusion protein, heavy metal efflux system
MNRILATLALCAPLILAGCGRHEHDAKASAPAGTKTNEPPAVSMTQYNEATQVFVEFPALVKDVESTFAAHMTRIADFKAVSEGTLTAALTGGGMPEERAQAGVSKTAGIFKPALKPRHAGKRRLVLTLKAPGLDSVHDLGEVDVKPDVRAAIAASPAEEGGAGIRFTKEQQWQMEFATVPAAAKSLRESVPASASIRPRASGEAQLAAPSAGVVRAGPQGFPQVGMRVAAGQVLAYVAPRLGGETDVASLTLDVERASAEAELAQAERARLEGLLKAEAVAEKRVQEARGRERIALAQARAARARIAVHQGESGGIALRSPIDGVVVAASGAPGAPVTEGQVVVHVADLSRLWLEARIAESDLAKVGQPGGAFFVLGEQVVALDVGRNARLVASGGLIDRESRTAPVIFEFANPGGALRAGMNVRAFVRTGKEIRALAIPVSAIVDDNGQPVVFVEKEGESYERRVIQPGLRDGDWVAVPAGVAEGERVVTRGAWQVRLASTSPAALGEGHSH